MHDEYIGLLHSSMMLTRDEILGRENIDLFRYPIHLTYIEIWYIRLNIAI